MSEENPGDTSGPLREWQRRMAVCDARLRPIAERPIDITDPAWLAKAKQRPHPLDEAGIRGEAETLLVEMVEAYPKVGEPARQAMRDLFSRYPAFAWAATLPFGYQAADLLRKHLLLFSLLDQGADSRDAILQLQELCQTAERAGIETTPILKEVAALSSNRDKQGMRSTRELLLSRAQDLPSP